MGSTFKAIYIKGLWIIVECFGGEKSRHLQGDVIGGMANYFFDLHTNEIEERFIAIYTNPRAIFYKDGLFNFV